MPMKITAVRRLEFDAGHTVTGHEGKCRNLHGHRYVAEFHVTAPTLDRCGRLIDFAVIKKEVGSWIDAYWDHRFLIYRGDDRLEALIKTDAASLYVCDYIPTAENMSVHLLGIANDLLRAHSIIVNRVRLYETPNAWVETKHESVDAPGQQRLL